MNKFIEKWYSNHRQGRWHEEWDSLIFKKKKFHRLCLLNLLFLCKMMFSQSASQRKRHSITLRFILWKYQLWFTRTYDMLSFNLVFFRNNMVHSQGDTRQGASYSEIIRIASKSFLNFSSNFRSFSYRSYKESLHNKLPENTSTLHWITLTSPSSFVPAACSVDINLSQQYE